MLYYFNDPAPLLCTGGLNHTYDVINGDWIFRPSPDDLPVWKGILPPDVNPYKYSEAIDYIENLLQESTYE